MSNTRHTISHKEIFLALLLNGYKTTTAGVCHGIGHMGKQAILAEDVETFDKRLFKIQNMFSDIAKVISQHAFVLLKQKDVTISTKDKLTEKQIELFNGFYHFLFKDLINSMVASEFGPKKNISGKDSQANFSEGVLNYLEKFKEKIKNKFESLTPMEKIEMAAFFSGVYLGQEPITSLEVLPESMPKIPIQKIHLITPITAPIALDEKGNPALSGIYESETLVNSFDLKELENFLIQIHDEVFQKTKGAKVLSIGGSHHKGDAYHAVEIGFNPKKNQWYFIDAEELPTICLKDSKEVAQKLMYIYSYKDRVSLIMHLSARKSESETIKPAFKKFQEKMLEKLSSNQLLEKNSMGYSLLFQSVLDDNETFATKFIEMGGIVNDTENKKIIMLKAALANKNAVIVEKLVEYGVNPNLKTSVTPLMFAVVDNNAKLAAILLKHGADPNLATTSGLTPMQHAASMKNEAMCKILIENGGDIDLPNQNNLNAIQSAGEFSNTLVKLAEEHAQTFLSQVKNYILKKEWEIKVWPVGGKKITYGKIEKIVPDRVKHQWDQIILAENGKKDFRAAMREVIQIGKNIQESKLRMSSSKTYYHFFASKNPSIITKNLESDGPKTEINYKK